MSDSSPVVHLDSAADGRCSEATIAAVTEHLHLEARIGGYVAEQRATPRIDVLRERLAELVGAPDGVADNVAFTESATTALQVLLRAWSFPQGATVAVAAGEWGPNLEDFAAAGLRAVDLPTHPDGLIDLEGVERLLRDGPPDLIHVVQSAAHRGLIQPGAEVAALGRAAGVPVWVDAAQAVGHVPSAVGATAVYGTSRKWLRGPRGVGFVVVDPATPSLRQPLRTYESREGAIAARVGLAQAVDDLWEFGVDATHDELAEVGRRTRAALADVPGWVVDRRPEAHPTAGAITTLLPGAGQDVTEVRERLIAAHGVLVTASLPWRAPLEPPVHALRVSPHIEVTDEDLRGFIRGLEVHP